MPLRSIPSVEMLLALLPEHPCYVLPVVQQRFLLVEAALRALKRLGRLGLQRGLVTLEAALGGGFGRKRGLTGCPALPRSVLQPLQTAHRVCDAQVFGRDAVHGREAGFGLSQLRSGRSAALCKLGSTAVLVGVCGEARLLCRNETACVHLAAERAYTGVYLCFAAHLRGQGGICRTHFLEAVAAQQHFQPSRRGVCSGL